MNTVRLPRIEFELVNDVIVETVRDAAALRVQIAANNTQFAVSPLADSHWIASSRREGLACAAAAIFVCVATLGTVAGLFVTLS